MRVVKAPDVRKAEILTVANSLFQTKGYVKTSVDEIVRQANIAKGTFYHYFKSKQILLNILTEQLVAEMAIHSQAIADDSHFSAIEKLCAIINKQHQLTDNKQNVVDALHLTENKELHERINIETVLVFGAILAKVIEQGNREGVFQVDDPLSTVQIILAGSQFLLGHDIFGWSPEQEKAKKQAMLILIERALAAKPGSLSVTLLF